MSNEIKNDIKKLLLLDSLLETSSSISRILDEAEEELEEIFGKSPKNIFDIDNFLKVLK